MSEHEQFRSDESKLLRWLRAGFNLLIIAILSPLLTATTTPIRAAATPSATLRASLELYGTFHAMGVIVTINASDDPDQDAIANVEYRKGSDAYCAGFPLSRVSSTRFVGSLFWLDPGTTYDVRVTFGDPDGALHNTAVSGTASTRAEITIPTPSRTYYVSPTGSGTACTLAAPCSLTAAVSQAQAGEEIVLRGGVYYQGEFTLPRSGAADAPIVIRSYSGENAILDGSDPATFTWTAQGGGVYRATVNASDPHVILANGARLFPYQSLSDLQNLTWGVPGFYASGATVYVRLANDANPNTAAMIVSRFTLSTSSKTLSTCST